MGLETFTGKVSDLVETNPPGTDPKSQGDDHLRGIKKTIIGQAIKTQVGQHATALENHFFDGSVPNQMTLKRGTPDVPGAEVLDMSPAGVTFKQAAGFNSSVSQLSGQTANLAILSATKASFLDSLKGPQLIAGGGAAYSLDASGIITLQPTNIGLFFIDIAAFSGLLIVNDHVAGAIAMYLCGGGTVYPLGGAAIGEISVTFNAPIAGYTIRNVTAGNLDLGVAAIRTRAAG